MVLHRPVRTQSASRACTSPPRSACARGAAATGIADPEDQGQGGHALDPRAHHPRGREDERPGAQAAGAAGAAGAVGADGVVAARVHGGGRGGIARKEPVLCRCCLACTQPTPHARSLPSSLPARRSADCTTHFSCRLFSGAASEVVEPKPSQILETP